MATVTKPIALDESFNTTELTPRNIADVLAEGLSHITGRTASEVEYDNTESGLTADDVQGAVDELSERPTLPSVDIQTAVDEFETYNGGLLSECIIELVPVQSGSGDPSPDNVRPISGHTEVDLDVKDGDNVTQHTYQVQIGSTVYGGYDEIVSGSGKSKYGEIDLGSLTWTYIVNYSYPYFATNVSQMKAGNAEILCSAFKAIAPSTDYAFGNNLEDLIVNVNTGAYTSLRVRWNAYSDPTALKTAVNGFKLVYELATPTDIITTPQQIETLAGQNNLSTPLDGQEITESKYKQMFTFDDVIAYIQSLS